jgi:hypothetical protein
MGKVRRRRNENTGAIDQRVSKHKRRSNMKQNPASQSGLFNPRTLCAFALYSFGAVLGMFSVAATPPAKVAARDTTALPNLLRPDQLAAGFVSSTSAVPPSRMASGPRNLPGARFPINEQVDSPSSGAAAGSPSTPAASSVANASWSIVNSPNAGFAPTLLSAVTCVSASDCWAVGRSDIGHTNTNTTLMRWDGSFWKVVPSPSVQNMTNGLVDITCVSSSSCWAVGYTINLQTVQVQTLTLHWDGISWQIVASPNLGNGFNALYGVACASDSECWAVGFENGGNLAQTLIERWDGISWTIHNSPNVGSQHNVLNAVTCVSSSDCRAVGYSGAAGAKSALVAQWDGTAWTASALPNPPLAQENTLSSVTCNSTSDCWAVGDSYNGTVHQPLIEQWNGTSWTSPATPNGGVDNYLSHVTCASASDCWVVGHSSNAAVDPQLFDQDLILHWNGSAWLLSAAPTDQGTTYANDLAGVACASGSECWAVGVIQPGESNPSNRALIIRWDGTLWTSVAAPDVPTTSSDYLYGVSCVSATDCWAVGFDFYGTIARSLITHWDGTSWAIKDSPNTAVDRSNYLSDVTCVSATDCWAVGQSSDTLDRARQALAMHWDGTTWSIMNPSNVDTSQAAETTMESISCVSTSDCWTVGFTSITQDPRLAPWIQHWNGQAWTSFPAPPAQYNPTSDNILYGVSCSSTSDCWAVGSQGTVPVQTLIDHWDGTSWSAVTSPNTSSAVDNILSAVTCASTTDCWAVGSSDNYGQALIERWDGTSWSIVTLPQTGEILTAVTCLSASDCWAAGPYYTPNPPAQTLLMHWDGTSWTKVASPNTSATRSNYLSGIACASTTGCWAVGQYSAGSENQTLILRYAPSLPPTSVISRKTHGLSGTFDIDLPLTGNPGIECRSGGADGDYTLVFTFGNTLASVGGASVTSGTGSVASNSVDSSDAHNYIVTLIGVTNAQVITVSLTNVSDAAGNFSPAIAGSMGVLLGDVNASGLVDSGDVFLVRQQTGQSANSSNFREDVNASGLIDSGDVFLTRQHTGTSLP